MRTDLLTLVALGAVTLNAKALKNIDPVARGGDQLAVELHSQLSAQYSAQDAAGHATQGVALMSDMNDVLQGFSEFASVGSKAAGMLGGLAKIAPFLGAAGFVLGIVGMFQPSEHDMVMKKLDEVIGKIDKLEATMKNEFAKMTSVVRTASCYNQIFADERKIIQAARHLSFFTKISKDKRKSKAYIEAAKQELLQTCGATLCRDATNNLLHALNGRGVAGCDFLATLYNHRIDGLGLRATGNKDYVAARATGLLSLIQTGVTVQAAVKSLSATTEAQRLVQWKVASDLFQPRIVLAVANVRRWLSRADREFTKNTHAHWAQLLLQITRSPAGAKYVTGRMAATYSDYKWATMIYGAIGGFNNHAVMSYQPVFMHWRHGRGFNIVTAGMSRRCRGRASTDARIKAAYYHNTHPRNAVKAVFATRRVRGAWAIYQRNGWAAHFGSGTSRMPISYTNVRRTYVKRVMTHAGFFGLGARYANRRYPLYVTSGTWWNC